MGSASTSRGTTGGRRSKKPPEAPLLPDLLVGQRAPEFSLVDDQGRTVRLSDWLGKKVVLYFYPKDDTPGCTKQACGFRDGIEEIRKRGAEVVGVSADPASTHHKFKEKYRLNFPLLSDVEKAVVRAYGVWKRKSFLGKSFEGVQRTTFLIDEHGRIVRIFPNVKVASHCEEVLEALG